MQRRRKHWGWAYEDEQPSLAELRGRPPGAAARLRVGEGEAVGSWRETFLRAPYLRDVLIAIGVLSETFETAWVASTAPNPEC